MKSWGYVAALIAALLFQIWHLNNSLERAKIATALETERAEHAVENTRALASHANKLATELSKERTAQSTLRTQTNTLRTQLAARQRDLEELKRENQELRDWADQPLPDAARRLRERPAFSGADAYRDWLSRRDAVPAAGNDAGQ
jgi:LysB family phage lysis regulatory protein